MDIEGMVMLGLRFGTISLRDSNLHVLAIRDLDSLKYQYRKVTFTDNFSIGTEEIDFSSQ